MMQVRFTDKAEDAINQCVDIARTYGHPETSPVHLAYALLHPESSNDKGRSKSKRQGKDSTESLFYQVVEKAQGDPVQFGRHLQKALVRLPTQEPPPKEPNFGPNMSKVVEEAHNISNKQKESYVAVDHLVLAVIHSSTVKNALKDSGVMSVKMIETAIKEIRGSKKAGESKSADSDSDEQYLSKYAVDMTEMAREGKIDPVIGREEEIRRVIRILCRRTKNNPVLIGEPGVGKTTIAEGLARRIINSDVPANLAQCRLLSLDVGALVAGASYHGEFEERLKGVLNEIQTASDMIVLFVDEIHLLMGAGRSSGGMDAANLLKPMLARGQLHCIGATTLAEYRKYIEKDAAFERRFQQVLVKEPSVPETISILRGLKERYEVHHGVNILDAAIVASANLAARYLTARRLPDSAIDLIDEAAAAVRVTRESQPEAVDNLERRTRQLEIEIHALGREKDPASQERLKEAQAELANLNEELRPLREKYEREKQRSSMVQEARLKLDQLKVKLDTATRNGDTFTASDLAYYAIPDIEKQIEKLEAHRARAEAEDAREHSGGDQDTLLVDAVGPDQINEIVAKWTGIPVTKLRTSEREKILNMEQHLSRVVVGQREAVTSVSNAIRLQRSGLANPNQPPSFLFCGPSGTGKTLLTKALAEFLFDDAKAMIRFDMSEYHEKHAMSRMIGAPPGYVGHESGGQLTEALRRRPFSILLFDEVEKAAKEVLTVLLQLMDDGRITDGQGRVVDGKNCIIVMTSNLGAQFLSRPTNLDGTIDAGTKELVTGALRDYFLPEFLNRISSIVIFNRLTQRDIRRIVDVRLGEIQRRLEANNKNIKIVPTEEVKDYLGDAGYSPIYGARPLQRLIEKEILNRLAVLILRGAIREGEIARVVMDRGRIVVVPNHLGHEGDEEMYDSDDVLEDIEEDMGDLYE
ncbi:Heat shock protein hsp98 [Myotisia sp. PD_48]|nr:Heat shock protein hsp98 [Myotisia sp. PD_48]